ncbi:hypothetical protein AGMMS50212_09520 [Spirochaetia bacterium]|nr:hypothetical protein AGMMS50212_09520 [Spirochaetia bacterium]
MPIVLLCKLNKVFFAFHTSYCAIAKFTSCTGIEIGIITSYFGTENDLVIPPEINGAITRIIGDGAFRSNKYLTKISMPNSITSKVVQI